MSVPWGRGLFAAGSQAPTIEACHSMLQHTENWVGTFGGENIRPKYQYHPSAVICQRWTVLSWLNGASVIERTLVPFLGGAICSNPGRGRSRHT